MLLCIDFQPAYAEAFAPDMPPLRRRLREAARKQEEVHFIYNEVYSLEGEELGDPLDRILSWGRKERLTLLNARMLRKNFGWVSPLVREGNSRKIAVFILRYLMDNGLFSSSEIAPWELEKIVTSVHGEFFSFVNDESAAWNEIISGAVAMPLVFEGGVIPWLHGLRREEVEIIGGFRERCLDEICMLLEAGGISYRVNESLTYSLPEELYIPAYPVPMESREPISEPAFFSDFHLIAV